MRITKAILAIGLLAAAATTVPNVAEARGGFRAGGAHFHGGRGMAGWHGGGTQWHAHGRPGWHGGGTRWAAGGRYYRGGYYGRGWGAAAAGVATGAALGAAAAYGSSCYQRQWNGYTYVTVSVC